MSDGEAAPGSPLDDLAARRERGEDRFDPVRFRFIEAFARRAAAWSGSPEVPNRRLVRLLADYDADRSRQDGTSGAQRADAAADPAVTRVGPRLADLTARLTRHAVQAGLPGRTGPDDRALEPPVGTAPAHPSLAFFRRTWSRLSADRRLAQSQAKVPDNAGPLHSHHLVHRSLTLMRRLSPGYLERFMDYADTLSWLEQATAGPEGRRTTSTAKDRGRSG